jgi:glyoxylase-like metal-dependent hydrolase (beta-lactamase superfamily II)
MKSINEVLLTLPENYTVYPGHGEKTSIGYEKENNPYIKNKNYR